MVLPQELSKAAGKVLAGATVIARFYWGRSAHSHGSLQRTASQHESDPRGSEIEHPGWEPQSFYNLILEVTTRHFCHIVVIVGSKAKLLTHTQWEGITHGHEYQEIERTIGRHPRGCLLQIYLLWGFLSI